jgi:hypothetical protein
MLVKLLKICILVCVTAKLPRILLKKQGPSDLAISMMIFPNQNILHHGIDPKSAENEEVYPIDSVWRDFHHVFGLRTPEEMFLKSVQGILKLYSSTHYIILFSHFNLHYISLYFMYLFACIV